MKLNDVDHIWVLLLVFCLILGVWLFTKAVWLEGSGRDVIVAIVAVTTSKKLSERKEITSNTTTLEVTPITPKE